MNIEPIGGAAVEENGLINGVLEAHLILSKDLLIGDAQLGLVLFGFRMPIRS